MDFSCDERPSDSPFVERIWRSRSEAASSFISAANPQWGMVVTRQNGNVTLTVRGPETQASPAYGPADTEYIGIQFKAGALMPLFPAQSLMNRADVVLPEASSQSFWLNGAAWQFPDFENADTFVEKMVRGGLLLYEKAVEGALQGNLSELSLRSVQRRFLRATGITHGTLLQIKRARFATTLLKQGVTILDTVYQAGYADQPHMTRSLRHYMGQTPAQFHNNDRTTKLSFLFEAHPDWDAAIPIV